MEQNWYSAKFYFIGLIALIFSSLAINQTFGQCVNIKDPVTGISTRTPKPVKKCLVPPASASTTFTIQFVAPVSNVTIDWGNGDIQTYPGPLTSVPYTYTTPLLFNYSIAVAGCTDTIRGQYINQYRNTVPGIGWITPPAGVDNKRCVPEALTIINASPTMNGYTLFQINWGDNTLDTADNTFMKSYTHTYQPGTTGCELQIKVQYMNACDPPNTVNPLYPRAGYGNYFFLDIDSAAVTPADIILCGPTDVSINDNTKLNCLDTANRQILWTRTQGFAADLPYPGDNVFRAYTPANRLMQIPASAFLPIPADSTYRLKMVISNTCGKDSADATIRIVAPTQPQFAVINDNTCPGEQMNFSHTTSHRQYQSYRVDFGDGTIANMGFSATFSHTYAIGGTYKVKLSSIVNGYMGQVCFRTDSIMVQVKTTVTPRVIATPLLGCDTITVLVKNASLNTAGVIWKGWDLGNGMTAGSGVLPSLINQPQAQVLSVNLTDSTAIIKYKEYGRYTIRLRAQSFGCPEFSDADTLYLYPTPKLRWKIVDPNICLGNSITVRDSSRVMQTVSKSLKSNWNHISWKLQMGDGTVYQSSSNITGNFDDVQGTDRLTGHTYAAPGIYWVKLTVQSPNRCPQVDSIKVTVLPAAVPNFTWVRDICNPGMVIIRNQTAGNAEKYEFIFRRGTSFFAKETRLVKDTFSYALPYFPPGDSTFYYVTLRAVSGISPDTCAASTAPVLIKIPPAKQAAFSASQIDGCTPVKDVAFVNQSIGIPSDGSHTYNWNFGNGNTFTGENPPLQDFVNNGTGFRRDTVRLIITSNGTCVYKAQKVITIYPMPNPQIVAPAEVCHNTPVTFSALGNGLGSYDWSFVELDGTNSSQPTPTRTFLNTGANPIQYNIKLTATTSAGCVDTVVKGIIVNPSPTASFTADPEAACGASPVLFDATSSVSATLFSWNFSDGTAGITDTTSPLVSRYFPENTTTIDRTYTVTLRTKTSKGCESAPIGKVIRIRPTVKADFTMDRDSSCNPLTVNFLNFSTQTDNNYTWYVNEVGAPGLGVPNLPNQPNRGFRYTFTNNTYNTIVRYVITLVVRDDNGSPICESSMSDTVTVLPKPLAAFTRSQITPSSLCSPTSMLVKGSGTQGATSYVWSFSDGATPIFANDSIPFFKTFFNNTTAIRDEYVRLVVANNFGCTDTAEQHMNIRPKVKAGATVDKLVGCSPLVSTFTNTSSSSAVSYTWYRNGIPVFFNKDLPPQTFQNNSATDTAVYNIFVVARGEGDVCTDTSATLKIRVLPKPTVVVGASPANGCSPLSVQLSAIGSLGGISYTWFAKKSTETSYTQIGTGSTPSPFTHVLTNSGAGAANYIIKLLITGAGNCTDSAFTNVTVFPDVAPDFTAPVLQGCSPLILSFVRNSGGPVGTSYIWKVDSIPQFNPFPSTFTYTFNSQNDTTPTTYVVSLQAISGSGCAREVYKTVTVFPKPQADFAIVSNPSTGCSPVTGRFIPNVPGLIASYEWVFDGADSLQTTEDTAVYRNYFNGGSQPFSHSIKLKVVSSQGCRSNLTQNLLVNPKVVAGFIQSAEEGCSPLSVTFTNSGSSAGANVFEWYVDGVLIGSSATGFTQSFTNQSFSSNRIYTIQLVAKNSFANACVDTATRFVTVYRKPEVTASAFPTVGCSPLSTTLTATNSQGGVLFQWYKKLSTETVYQPDTTTSTGDPLTRKLFNTGSNVVSYDLKLVVTGADGCKDSTTVSVSVAPGLQAGFTTTPGNAGCAPFAAVFANNTTSPAANSFNWLVDGLTVSNSPAFLNYSFPNTSNTDPRIYKVQLVASNATFGCPDTATQNITVWPVPISDLAISMDPISGCSPVVVGFKPVNNIGVSTYNWYFPDTLVTTQDTTVSRTFVNNTVVPQVKWVTLKSVNTFGCEALKTSNFQVNPRVVAGFTPSQDSVCSPASITFTSTSSPGVNVAEWYVDGTYRGNSLSNITELFTNNDAGPKTFVIKLVVRNSITTACEDEISKTITIFPKPIAGNIFASAENGCSPLAVDFTGSASFADRFVWDFGDGSNPIDTNSQQVGHLFTNLNPISNAQYTVTQIAINSYGCADSTSTLINVRPNVTAGIIASDSVGCSPLPVSFSGAASINANSYNWNFGNGNTATGVNVNRIFTNNSDTTQFYTIQLVADRAGVSCPDTASVQIKVFPKPKAGFDASPNAGCQPLPVQFTNTSALMAAGYWVITAGPAVDTLSGTDLAGFDTTFANTTSLNQIVTAELFISSTDGCTDRATRLITVSPFVNADFAQSADSGCSPLSVGFTNLSAPGASSSWYIDGVLANNASGQFNYSFVNNTQNVKWFEVKLVVSNVLNSGCTDTLVRLVKVFPKPVAGTLGAVPDNGCSPLNIGLFSNAIGATRYMFDFNDGAILDTTVAAVNHSFVNNAGLTNRNFNVKLVVSNPFGCTDNTARLITVKPTVAAVIASSDTIGCTPFSVQLSGLNSINSNNYSWDFGDGTGSVLATPTKVYNNNSDTIQHYTISLVTDRTGVGCPDTAYFPVTVYPKPVAEFAPNPLIGCNPLFARLTNLTTGAVSATWNFSGNGLQVSHPVTGPYFDTTFVNDQSNLNMTVDLSIVAINNLGCSDTKTRTVTIYPAVQAAFTQSQDSGCSPLKVRFSNQSLPGNLVQWFVDGTLSSTLLSNFDYTFVNDGLTPKVFEIKMISRAALAQECQDTTISYVKVYPKPNGGFINAMPEIACSPARIDFVGTAVGATQYIWNFGDGTELDTNQQEVFHVFSNTNSTNNRVFNVRQVSVNAWGCSDTVKRNVTIRPLVTARILTEDSVGCSPFTANFNGSQSTNANQFEWDFGGMGTSTLMNPGYTFTNNSDTAECHTVRLITRKSNIECADTAYFKVCVNPLPRPQFNINPISGCQPLAVSVTNQSELTVSSTWQFISGGIQNEITATNYDTVVANPTAQIKIVRVVLQATSAQGCAAKLEKQFTVSPFVKAEFGQSIDSGCSPLRVTFVNLSSTGSSAAWFADGNPISSSNGTFSYTFINNSTQVLDIPVKLVVRNNLSATCTDTIVKSIRVFPKPDAGTILASPESGCSPLASQLSAAPNLGSRFIWDFRDGTVLDTTALVVDHTFVNYNPSANVPFNVMFITTTTHGCTDTTYKPVVVSPFTIARIGVIDTSGCSTLTTQLAGALSQNANRFVWDFGDGTSTSFAANPVHTFSNLTQQNVSYTVRLIASRQGFDCPDTAYKTVHVYPNPRAKFNASTYSGCGPLQVQFVNESELADSTMWVISSIAGVDTLFTNASTWDTIFSNPYPQQLNVQVKLTVWTSKGCSSTLTRNIIVNPDVTALFTATANGCSPLMVQFTNLSTNPGGAYQWNFGDGSPVSSTPNPGHVFRYNGGSDTTFNVSVLAISNPAFSPACNKTYSLPVKVFAQPKPAFVMDPEILQLPQETVVFTNTTPYRPNWKYRWYFGDNTQDTSGALTVNHDYSALVSELSSTNVTVKLVAYNGQGCADTTYQTLQIRPVKPIVNFGPDTAGCAPLVVSFRNYSQYGNQYFWTFGDGSTSTEQNPVKRYETPGEYSVSLKVIGPGGETVLKRDNIITVYELPDASFTTVPKAPRAIKIPEEKMNCFVRYPQPGWSYEWDFGDGSSSRDKDPVHQYLTPGNYTISLKITSAEGCVAYDTLSNGAIVEKGNLIIIPNAFTPRDDASSDGYVDKEDGTNDIFYPFTEGVTDIRIQIFNRWGQFIYQSTTLNKGWDGTFEGSPCKSDVYVYKVWARFVDGRTETKVGDLTLLR